MCRMPEEPMTVDQPPTADAGAKPAKPSPPWPTVAFREHPWRWVINKVQELLISIPFSHVFLLAWIAVYYILTQSPVLNPLVKAFGYHGSMKQWWDTLLSNHLHVLSAHAWKDWRHIFRSGGEAYLGSLMVLFFTFNPYKHKFKRLHSYWQVPPRGVLALLLAIPLFVGLGLLVHHAQHWLHTGVLAPAINAHPNLAQKLYTDTWTTKLVVFVSLFIGRRPMFGVFDFIMRRFAERRVAAGKHAHFWHTAPYRAMVRTINEEEGADTVRARRAQQSNVVGRLELATVLLVVGLAGYGIYILQHFART
jgi:hypothetical protein